MFKRTKKASDPNAIEPTKLNSSKVIVNLRSGNSKKVTKAMLEGFKTRPYDKDIYFVFGSGLEAKYYTEELLPKINAGKILVRFQPRFEILKKLEKDGVKHLAITYTPDFGITPIEHFGQVLLYGTEYFVDVKGMSNETFPLKHKMFDAAYPDFPALVVMKHWKARGGWMTLKEFDAIKKADKKAGKLAAVKEA
ncbi:DUF1064 domain-containing protein [Paenibacillus psychroresistens]|uniref:DUF1064 domain-containing protein n=1 Tax=Paenibacillus psychroresistens TaxID=1778678 RepID=A0A6B8RML9_9BACL|nr:DUF1064 domain-containing protein [Paenibacillus psychroresistens]QGQ97014.1 DUF1064 domain-containing protein [Paenibacillus psychroresistens]